MTVYYNQATWPATTTGYCANFETALLAAGWTIVDTISTSPYQKVFRCPDINGVTGVYFFLHIRDVGSIGIVVNNDYDATTHTDIMSSGNVSGGGLSVPGGPGYIYCNSLGMAFCVIDGLYNRFFWFGQPRTRQTYNQSDGLCLSTGTMAVGATSVTVSQNLVGRLYVGQKIAIQNFAHSSASANKNNSEIVTITAVTSTSLSFTATTKAYDNGAKMGPPDMLWPVGPALACTFGSYNGAGSLSCCMQTQGMEQGAANVQNTVGASAGVQFATGNLSAFQKASTLGLAPEAFVPTISSTLGSDIGFANPLFGFLMVGTNIAAGVPAAGTKYTDGTNVYVQPNAANAGGGGANMLMGPTGDVVNLATQTRILPPQIPVSDTIYTFPPVVGPPASPPTVANVNPAGGTTLGRTSPIQLDVLDTGDALRAVILMAYWSDNSPPEVIHDGDNFVGLYTTYSVKSVITNGYHFFIQRTGGWPSASVTFKPVAIDVGGAENS